MGITGIYNVEIGLRPRSDVHDFYEETLQLTGMADSCPKGHFSVGVDRSGSTSSALLTFAGSGNSIRAITFAVARGTLPKWRAVLLRRGVRVLGRAWQFDEEYLCFLDGSNFDLALTEAETDAEGIRFLRSIEIDSGPTRELERLFETAGLKSDQQEGPIIRYRIGAPPPSVAVDIFRSSKARYNSELGLISPQRLSFSVSGPIALAALERQLQTAGFAPSPFCERTSAFAVRLTSLRDLEIGFVCEDQSIR